MRVRSGLFFSHLSNDSEPIFSIIATYHAWTRFLLNSTKAENELQLVMGIQDSTPN